MAISLYNNTLQNCFPGNGRTILFISGRKQGSQNFRRVQAGALDKVVPRNLLFGA